MLRNGTLGTRESELGVGIASLHPWQESLAIQASPLLAADLCACSWVRYPDKNTPNKTPLCFRYEDNRSLNYSSSAHILMIVFVINDILLSKIQKITGITPEGSCWQLCTRDCIAVHEAFFLYWNLMQRWNFMSGCWHSHTTVRFLNGIYRDD